MPIARFVLAPFYAVALACAAIATKVEWVRGSDVGFAPSSSPEVGAADVPVWIVRLTGRFVDLRTPPGVPAQVLGAGFHLVDDATGEIVGRGGRGQPAGGAPQSPSRLTKGR